MDSDDSYFNRDAERIERTLRIVWGEVAPRTYADVPTYGDLPTYDDMERVFGGKENWPKRDKPTVFPDEPRFRPTYGPLPAKDWNAAAPTFPPKDWGSVSKPKGPSGGP